MPIGASALKLNPGYLPRFGRSGGNLWAFAEVTLVAKNRYNPKLDLALPVGIPEFL